MYTRYKHKKFVLIYLLIPWVLGVTIASRVQHSFLSATWRRRLVQQVFRGIVGFARFASRRQETVVGFTRLALSLPETRQSFSRCVNPSRDALSLPEAHQVIKGRVQTFETPKTQTSVIVSPLARSCGCGPRLYHSLLSRTKQPVLSR